MRTSFPGIVPAALFIGLSVASSPAGASLDYKLVDGTSCQPYGPGTTTAELTYNQLGITNPGTTNESVLCPMPSDGDVTWGPTPGASAGANVHYHVGAVAGRLACTAFVGKANIGGTTYTVTVNPANSVAGTSSHLTLPLADSAGWGAGPPTVLLCTLTPKVTLAAIDFHEMVVTDTP